NSHHITGTDDDAQENVTNLVIRSFVQCYSSRIWINIQYISMERYSIHSKNCVSIIDIFLNHLKHLSYVKMNYDEILLINDPISRDYIIEKRRQTFPMNIFNQQLIDVENNGKAMEIWLS
ncbi:unnamed protein product, partial [Rotaria sp. Silwood2]